MADNEGRPRRSTRAPAKGPTTVVQESPLKRKTRDPEAQLDYLLTNAKSKLTTLEISDIVSYENFLNLSPESQQALCSLLPPTAFSTFQSGLHPAHPAKYSATTLRSPGSSSKAVLADMGRSTETLDPMVFTNTFFLSAARTFQDHVFSGWLSQKQRSKVVEYEQGVRDGSMHAQWKDEEWEQNHKPPKHASRQDLDLIALAQRSQVREGDIIMYRRRFISPPITVEKELLVHSINPQSFALSFFLSPNVDRALPPYLLPIAPSAPQPPILTMESIMSSAELEDGVLDVDGRVSRDARSASEPVPPSNVWVDFSGVHQSLPVVNRAAKCLTIWRWEEDRVPDVDVQMYLDKGGRVYVGTVYYLRRA